VVKPLYRAEPRRLRNQARIDVGADGAKHRQPESPPARRAQSLRLFAGVNMDAGEPIHLKMLGPMTVARDGRALALPRSRKTRALLAYLALAPRHVTRDRLCELLWDGPNDPRGELRWCLSKIRRLFGGMRVNSDDGALRLDLSGFVVDALEVERAAIEGFDTLAPERARSLVGLFGGDFLQELEIDRSPVFSGWLIAERRRFRSWHVALLERLANCAADEESLGHLEKWIELAPFERRAHALLLRALARLGRVRDGEEHLAAALRLFEAEGIDNTTLRQSWQQARAKAADAVHRERRPDGAEKAHEHYQQGRLALTRVMRRGLLESREMFVRSIELEPGFAPAWAGLATAHALLHELFGTGSVGLAKAEATSRRALELAPCSAEAHAAQGLVRSLSRHYHESECEFEQAIRIDPYLFDAYYYFARTSFARGDARRSAQLFGLAAQARESDFQSPLLLAQSLRASGCDDLARDAARTAIRRAEQVLALDPDDGRALSLIPGSLLVEDQVERALACTRRSLDLHTDDAVVLLNGAGVYAQVGLEDRALDLLEHVFAQGCGNRDWVANDPDYGPLRNDPRFQRLLARLTPLGGSARRPFPR
jgi:DNA-binding SARP family transcriptional activator